MAAKAGGRLVHGPGEQVDGGGVGQGPLLHQAGLHQVGAGPLHLKQGKLV